LRGGLRRAVALLLACPRHTMPPAAQRNFPNDGTVPKPTTSTGPRSPPCCPGFPPFNEATLRPNGLRSFVIEHHETRRWGLGGTLSFRGRPGS